MSRCPRSARSSTSPRRPSTWSRSATRSGSRRRCSTSARSATGTGASCCSSSAWSLSVPARLPGRAARRRSSVLFVRARRRRALGGHGLPDDARADHRAVVGPGAARSRSRCGRRIGGAIAALGPLVCGAAARALLVGVGVPASRCRSPSSRSSMALKFVPGHVNETTEPVDNLGGVLSVVLVGALILGDQLRAGAERDDARARPARDRRRGAGRLLHPAAPGARTRSTTSTSPARPTFWVAACAGIIVFGSLMGAMFIGQQFLQNVLGYSTRRGRRRDPARGRLHGRRRAALGQARRGARRPVHAALRLRLRAARLPHDAAALEGGHLRTGRSRSATRSSASASGSRARRPRTR